VTDGTIGFRSKPFVVEVIGLPGSGKSSLTEAAAKHFQNKGMRVVIARKGTASGNAGLTSALGQSLSAMAIFLAAGAGFRTSVRRTIHGLPAAIAASATQSAAAADILLREPGWCMQLAGLSLADGQPRGLRPAQDILSLGTLPDLLLLFDVPLETALARMTARERGMPKILRGISHDIVQHRMAAVGASLRSIAAAAETAGIRVSVVNADDGSVDQVADRTIKAIEDSIAEDLPVSG